MMQFLKPDMLRRYVGTIDAEVARHLDARWVGRRTVTVLPLMKLLTFDIIATLLFDLERGAVRERLAAAFADMLEGIGPCRWTCPSRRSARASGRARGHGEASPADDLVSCLASLRAEDGGGGGGERMLTDEEIVVLD
jgi:cytochrome P450